MKLDLTAPHLLMVTGGIGAGAREGAGEIAPWPGEAGEYHGYERHDFTLDGCACTVVLPTAALPGRPWIWRAEFFDAFPQIDLALLKEGFHLAYMNVGNTFGCPSAMAHFDVFYDTLVNRHELMERVVLEGLSRGGLYVYHWGASHPDKVACILGDNPVCDIKSWPAGRGRAPGSPNDWKKLIADYGFRDEAEALAYDRNPLDWAILKPLAQRRVPLLHICGDADEAVPYEENTAILRERYEQLGGPITVIIKPGQKHHPHGLEDPAPAVAFIREAVYGKPR